MIKKITVLFAILLAIPQLSMAQDGTISTDPVASDAQLSLIRPVLPQTGSSIIFIEGEDAVATNFNREPILNYSASGYRTLQLNNATGLQGNTAYYADFVFYVEEGGVYEFWYGGTPPGNKEELLPSFASPFRYILDSFYQTDVYREDVNVVSGYAPAYYWNYVSDLTLSVGEHQITFEVPERRTFDSKFFFYLDNFFLIKKENGTRVMEGRIPDVFPADMDDRSIDIPFKSIEDYEILIRDNPEQVHNYIEISMIYSLIGDYLSSLKNLRKAILLEPDDPEIMLLIAKNLIWKGAYSDGLYVFSDLLKLVPEKIEYWTEAGKVAAWVGQYGTSKKFFEDGIEYYPENLNLQANLGITYLWSGDLAAAQKQFKIVSELAGDDLILNKGLAKIFEVNGYPDKAIEIYLRMIKQYPEDLETRFLLEDAYIQNNQNDKITSLRKSTAEAYETSSEFEKVIQVFYNKQVMKDRVITDYEDSLANDPDNLSLRKTLAEIYFWNGNRKKAIDEYLNILINYSYRNIRETEKNTIQFYEIIDRNYALLHFIEKVPAYLTASMKELSSDLNIYKRTADTILALEKKNSAALEKGAEPDLVTLASQQEQLIIAEDILASRIAAKEGFIEKYQFLMEQFKDDTEYMERLFSEETAAGETFQKLAKGSKWAWDKESMVRELDMVYKNGLDMAGYVLGRINQIEGSLGSSAVYLDKLVESDKILEEAPFAAFQNSLWIGNDEKRSKLYEAYPDKIIAYADYVYDIVDFIDFLKLKDDEVFGFLSEDPAGAITDISKRFTEIKTTLREVQTEIQANIVRLHGMLEEKMIQGFYRLAGETYLIRNELGDFYQNEKMYPEAIDQFRQVLSIEPFNLSAKYKLGQVYQWNGNWKRALDYYEEVYVEDPVFGNVTAFYNQLAREHADNFKFIGKTYADTSKMNFEASASYNTNVNGVVAVGLDYIVSNNRIYRDFAPETASNYLLHDLSMTVPLDLSLFVLSPHGGVFALSQLTNSIFTGTPSMGDFLGRYNFYPHGGISASLWTGPVGVYGGYQYSWEKDSFQPDRSAVSYQKGELSVQVDFNFTQVPVLKETSSLVSGFGRFVEDGNIIYGGSLEILNEVKIRTNPDISINLAGRVIYEDSTQGSNDNYWAPKNSLTAGGGLEAAALFNLSDKVSIGDKLGFAANYFYENSGSGVDFVLGNTFDYVNGDFNGYIKLEGTMRYGGEFWSLGLSIGTSSGLPELLSL